MKPTFQLFQFVKPYDSQRTLREKIREFPAMLDVCLTRLLKGKRPKFREYLFG